MFGYDAGESDIIFYLYDIQCTGNETNLLECMYGEFGEHNCFPYYVRGLGVSCGNFLLIHSQICIHLCRDYYYC